MTRTATPTAPSAAAVVFDPSTSTKPPRPALAGHLACLDGLRGCAILAVLIQHAGVGLLPHGGLGVDLFFVLSGYLITALLLREWDETNRIHLGRFYARRALRLLPALLVLLVAYLGLAALLFREPLRENLVDAGLFGFYVSNWTLCFGLGRPRLLIHGWSLAIEEQFYLLWPLLLIALLRWLPTRRALARGLLVGLFAAWLWRAFLWYNGASVSRLYYGFDTRLDTLLIGCYLAAATIPEALLQRPGLQRWLTPAGLTATIVLGLLAAHHGDEGGTDFASLCFAWQFPITLACAGLVLAVLGSPRGWLRRAMEIPALVGLGRISYGLYLWHYLIFQILLLAFHYQPLAILLVGSVLSLIASLLSYVLVERPFLRLKKRFSVIPPGERPQIFQSEELSARSPCSRLQGPTCSQETIARR